MPTPPTHSRSPSGRRRAAYDAYLTSRTWKDRRRAWYASWLTVNGTAPTCRVCGKVWTLKNGHLHHLTYQRIGAEDDTDLIPLCAVHHARLHELLVKPRWRRLGRAAASLQIVIRLAARHSARDGAAPWTPSRATPDGVLPTNRGLLSGVGNWADSVKLTSAGASPRALLQARP